ncbi:glycosyltransferase family 1 protein [Paenibacillus alvei]|uniref:glycosyltransferase family 4 protein n=1 Tax=Paenibacillus alvei TaxID=44250 RepID=UPI003D2656A5
MKIMIWCANLISAGGGSRLLLNLLPAMARQVDIDLVRLVIAPETKFKERIDIGEYQNIEIVYFSGSIQSPEGNSMLLDCHVVYFFWPHGPEYVKIQHPTICTFHDTTVMDFVPQYLTGSTIQHCWKIYEDWIVNMTSVVVSSNHVKSRLIEYFGMQCNECHVIPHAILPAERLTIPSVRADLLLRLPTRYVLYPSNISPHKNHYNLLLAYSKFAERSKVPLVLFGHNTELLRNDPPHWPDHYYVPTLISLMKRIGLKFDEDVYPMGFIPDPDVLPLISNAQALIMPSLSEGGGSYPVEEALRLGVPVLCSDIPVMREHLARHSAEIVWFDPESPESIAQALTHLFSNYARYKASAVQGMHDPSETWDDVARKYIHIFRLAYLKHHGLL